MIFIYPFLAYPRIRVINTRQRLVIFLVNWCQCRWMVFQAGLTIALPFLLQLAGKPLLQLGRVLLELNLRLLLLLLLLVLLGGRVTLVLTLAVIEKW